MCTDNIREEVDDYDGDKEGLVTAAGRVWGVVDTTASKEGFNPRGGE